MSDPQNKWLKHFVERVNDGQLDLFPTAADRPRRGGFAARRKAAADRKRLASNDDSALIAARRFAFLDE